jgi:hypothetical protein
MASVVGIRFGILAKPIYFKNLQHVLGVVSSEKTTVSLSTWHAVPRFTPKATTAPQAAARSLEESDPKGPAVVYLAKFLAADLENLVLTGPKGGRMAR